MSHSVGDVVIPAVVPTKRAIGVEFDPRERE